MATRKNLSRITKQYRNRVRSCRMRAEVATQADLAGMTGLSRSTINALEKNRLFLSSHYALLIAAALNCKLDDLFEKRQRDSRLRDFVTDEQQP